MIYIITALNLVSRQERILITLRIDRIRKTDKAKKYQAGTDTAESLKLKCLQSLQKING